MHSSSSIGDCDEGRPLLRSLSDRSVNRIWVVLIVGGLAAAWCVMDSWNHDMSSLLFQISEVKSLTVDHATGTLTGKLEPFKYTLTLIFLQFAFVGVVFCAIFIFKAVALDGDFLEQLSQLRPTTSAGRWPALVGTHIFSSLLLQSVMMPTHIWSLGFFAATRAVEVPVAAGLRAKMFGSGLGSVSLRTTMLMSAAVWLLFYSYTEIAECLCVWSGFGVALTGAPLYFVYMLLLVIPAANVVLQESVLVQLQVNPILMQGVQNLCAALLFAPILIGAHVFGFEDVHHAATMITGHREVYMTILWLCVQFAVLSAITVGLILTVDSFWTVAARSLRVVFWWVRQLSLFYITSGSLLSVSRPHASLWSFVMLCGLVLGFSALITDCKHVDEKVKGDLPPERIFATKGLGVGKYV